MQLIFIQEKPSITKRLIAALFFLALSAVLFNIPALEGTRFLPEKAKTVGASYSFQFK